MLRASARRTGKDAEKNIEIKHLTSLQINQIQQFLSVYKRLDLKKNYRMEDYISDAVLATITTLYCADCEFEELTEVQKIQRLTFVLRAQKKYAKQFLADRLKNMKFVLLEGRTYYESCLAHILEGCRLSELFDDGEIVHDILTHTRMSLPQRLGLGNRDDITLFGQLAFLLEVNRHRCPSLKTVKEDKTVLELEVESLMNKVQLLRAHLKRPPRKEEIDQSQHEEQRPRKIEF